MTNLNVETIKSDKRIVTFNADSILDILKREAIIAAGFDPDHFEADDIEFNITLERKRNQIHELVITIVNPNDTSPKPAKSER